MISSNCEGYALWKYLKERIFIEIEKKSFDALYVHTGAQRCKNFPGILAVRSIYDAISIDVRQNLEAVYFLHLSLQARLFLTTFGRFFFTNEFTVGFTLFQDLRPLVLCINIWRRLWETTRKAMSLPHLSSLQQPARTHPSPPREEDPSPSSLSLCPVLRAQKPERNSGETFIFPGWDESKPGVSTPNSGDPEGVGAFSGHLRSFHDERKLAGAVKLRWWCSGEARPPRPLFLVHLATIPIIGTGINPARSLDATIIYNKQHAWDDHNSYQSKIWLFFQIFPDYLWEHVRRSEIEVPDFVYDHDEDLDHRPMMDYGLESDHPRVYDAPAVDSPVSMYSMRCIS
ncbi:hypothetical protein DVH24_029672 [Malus domestica]|uniref:CRAL-TRIO domain-containing protein n=1 Tax=Malus domestica TaxID=3750 RepID=A0A498I0K2_MALDO|nr:hypothetical protein DVH24_029672 [Malus domestica]